MFRRSLVQPTYLCAGLLLALAATAGFAQVLPPDAVPPGGDFAPPPAGAVEKVPTDRILVKGAEASASDHKTPLPEEGSIVKGVYQNRYFGITYPLPADWSQPFDGPPPSDSGGYVLTNLVPSASYKGPSRGTALISAQDTFFSLIPADDAKELIAYRHDHLEPYYDVERKPEQLTIAGRTFSRFDYQSKVAWLHWVVLATEIRCHTLQFVFNSRDPQLLESMVKGLDAMTVTPGDAPLCVADYATREHVVTRVEPAFKERRFNPIPVRVMIDKRGNVKHVHVLSAFPEQSQAVTDALMQWKFMPYVKDGQPVDIETGIMFGAAPTRRKPGAAAAPAVTAARD